MKIYQYSDHPHLRKSSFLTKFGRYQEGIKGDKTEYNMCVSFIKNKGKGLFFNEFRREKIEFTKENFISYIVRKGEEYNLPTINMNTLQKDFDVLTKTYIRSEVQIKDKEDTLSGLLTDLNIIQEEKRRINEKTEVLFSVTADERIEIPDEVLLYGILDNDNFDKSISFYTIEQEKDQVGSVFAINRTGLLNKMESITANPKYKKYGIVFNDHAGIKELQFKIKPNKFEIMNNYYGN